MTVTELISTVKAGTKVSFALENGKPGRNPKCYGTFVRFTKDQRRVLISTSYGRKNLPIESVTFYC